jgi:transposase-like protein
MTDLFKWRHYESEIILTCVRWYLRYALSYRDLEEMMTERACWLLTSSVSILVRRLVLSSCRPQ